MAISTQMVKELREATGAGVLDCKKALEATDGDFDKAAEYLREKGLDAAAKKATREANDGLVNVLVDKAGHLGVIVEVNCETDFVARTEDFQGFVTSITRQLSQETEVSDAPALLKRRYIEDQSITIGERLTQLIAKLGENMVLRRVARIEQDGNGLIEGYLHPGSRIGVLVYVSTDKEKMVDNEVFQAMVHDIALQIAASAPQYISIDDMPEAAIKAEQTKYWAQLSEENKPDHIKERIVSGRLEKWYQEVCLMRQPFIKDGDLTVGDLLANKSRELDASLVVEQFVRYELGLGE